MTALACRTRLYPPRSLLSCRTVQPRTVGVLVASEPLHRLTGGMLDARRVGWGSAPVGRGYRRRSRRHQQAAPASVRRRACSWPARFLARPLHIARAPRQGVRPAAAPQRNQAVTGSRLNERHRPSALDHAHRDRRPRGRPLGPHSTGIWRASRGHGRRGQRRCDAKQDRAAARYHGRRYCPDDQHGNGEVREHLTSLRARRDMEADASHTAA